MSAWIWGGHGRARKDRVEGVKLLVAEQSQIDPVFHINRLVRFAMATIQEGHRRGNASRRRGFRVLHNCGQRVEGVQCELASGLPYAKMILLTSIVWGVFGRPPGFPETPGLKLVDRIPPRGIASVRLLDCLFLADNSFVLNGSWGLSRAPLSRCAARRDRLSGRRNLVNARTRQSQRSA